MGPATRAPHAPRWRLVQHAGPCRPCQLSPDGDSPVLRTRKHGGNEWHQFAALRDAAPGTYERAKLADEEQHLTCPMAARGPAVAPRRDKQPKPAPPHPGPHKHSSLSITQTLLGPKLVCLVRVQSFGKFFGHSFEKPFVPSPGFESGWRRNPSRRVNYSKDEALYLGGSMALWPDLRRK